MSSGRIVPGRLSRDDRGQTYSPVVLLVSLLWLVAVIAYLLSRVAPTVDDDAKERLTTVVQAVQELGEREPSNPACCDGNYFGRGDLDESREETLLLSQSEADDVLIEKLQETLGIGSSIKLLRLDNGWNETATSDGNILWSGPVFVQINAFSEDEVDRYQMVRAITLSDDTTSFCAVLVRRGDNEGVGYDAWDSRGNVPDGFSGARTYHAAHCAGGGYTVQDQQTGDSRWATGSPPGRWAAVDTQNNPSGSYQSAARWSQDQYFSDLLDPRRQHPNEGI